MRERDLAAQLGISGGGTCGAHCGEGVQRVEPRVNDLLPGLEAVGEVVALTRNESAVHEKIGVYDKVQTGDHAALVLGADIDLRIFPKHGRTALPSRNATATKSAARCSSSTRRARPAQGHLRPASNLYAYQKLVAELASDDQSPDRRAERASPESEPRWAKRKCRGSARAQEPH